MKDKSIEQLSRRERQIMSVIYQRGEATVADVVDGLADPPGYSAVRTFLSLLESKGYVRHRLDGRAYVYSPVVSRERAKHSALKNVVQIFFDDSVEHVVATLIDMRSARLSDQELESLEQLIRARRERGAAR